MAQLEFEKQVGIGVEVVCSQLLGPVVEVESGSGVMLIGDEAIETLGLVVEELTAHVSVLEVSASPLVHMSPRLKTGTEDETRCSVASDFLTVVSVMHVGSTAQVGPVCEVTAGVVQITSPVVKAGPDVQVVMEARDPVLHV